MSRTGDQDCPCGTGFTLTDCCGPLVRGAGFADTAEDLMRSRYTAHVLGLDDYLEATARPGGKKSPGQAKEKPLRWVRLDILGARGGGRAEDEGEVEFAATFLADSGERVLHEISKFRKLDGRWYYCPDESKILPEAGGEGSAGGGGKPFIRREAKTGRNDPCPCGSGKKHKKCCGR